MTTSTVANTHAEGKTRTQSAATKRGSRSSAARGSAGGSTRAGDGGKKTQPQTLETWVFESAGPRKYAVQVRKARNGNPHIRLVEGKPQDDGTYQKFHLNIWSEDFERFFAVMDQMRAFIESNKITTPAGHKYRPAPAGKRGPSQR